MMQRAMNAGCCVSAFSLRGIRNPMRGRKLRIVCENEDNPRTSGIFLLQRNRNAV